MGLLKSRKSVSRGSEGKGSPGVQDVTSPASPLSPEGPAPGGLSPIGATNAAQAQGPPGADSNGDDASTVLSGVPGGAGDGSPATAVLSAFSKLPSDKKATPSRVGAMQQAAKKVTVASKVTDAMLDLKRDEEVKQSVLRYSTQFSVSKKLDRPMTRIHVVKIMQLCFLCYLGFLALLVKLFSPSLFWMFFAALGAFPLGVGLSFMFHYNRVDKLETRDKLNVEPGVQGLKQMLHQNPSWLSFQDKEKVEWINKFLQECWPFYDKAICAMIKEMVEPEVDKYKPSFISSIGFKNLTFGDSPFKIDTIWTDKEETGRLVMEIVFRWQGDANIGLYIALQGLNQLGGDATKMVVKLTKLQLSGTLRITLSPLVDKIPGFGAITAALTKSPIIKYNLDFGKALGSSFSASLVRNWLDPFIRNTLMELLVWPERIVVPMLPESDTGPLTYLKKRTVGVLKVTLAKAWNLKVMDSGMTGGSADPFVCMWSNPQRKVETKVVKNTLAPAWEETFYILVQEPTTQMLKLELYDYDTISIKELGGGLNIIKNIRNVYGARELMGRAIVPMKPFCESTGSTIEQTHDVGLQDWSSIGGPGKGEGKIMVRAMYSPASVCRGLGFKTGCLAVKVFSVVGLSGLGATSDMSVYIRLKLTKQKTKQSSRPTVVKPPKRDPNTHKVEETPPTWTETFLFYDVRKNDELVVKIVETDTVSDETQGVVYMPLEDHVISMPESTINKWYKMEETSLPSGKFMQIHMRSEWLGFIPEDEGWEDRV